MLYWVCRPTRLFFTKSCRYSSPNSKKKRAKPGLRRTVWFRSQARIKRSTATYRKPSWPPKRAGLAPDRSRPSLSVAKFLRCRILISAVTQSSTNPWTKKWCALAFTQRNLSSEAALSLQSLTPSQSATFWSSPTTSATCWKSYVSTCASKLRRSALRLIRSTNNWSAIHSSPKSRLLILQIPRSSRLTPASFRKNYWTLTAIYVCSRP